MKVSRKAEWRWLSPPPSRVAFLPALSIALSVILALTSLFVRSSYTEEDRAPLTVTADASFNTASSVSSPRQRYTVTLPLSAQIHPLRHFPAKERTSPSTYGVASSERALPSTNGVASSASKKSHSAKVNDDNAHHPHAKEFKPPTCKWGKYANWPYTDEFPLLSPLRKKVAYIKVPKSSSSTIAHILQRYTTRQGMKVGYPDFRHNEWTFDSKESFEGAMKRAGLRNGEHFDAVVSHMVYSRRNLGEFLGTERPFRIASIRRPANRAWSMFLHGLELKLVDFNLGAKDPWTFARKVKVDDQFDYARGWSYGYVGTDVRGLSKHFDHLVVSERVLESMVTLAPKLGLRASDLLYFSQKTSMHKTRPRDLVTPAQKRAIDAIINGKSKKDQALYDNASWRLDREMAALPDKIKSILADVPAMKREVEKVCGSIDPEDNRCLSAGEVVWDGNQVCLTRCIERWARIHVECAGSTNTT